ncbi:MAG: Hsp33 family molecular chaperone HslO, partial [Gammaproteobacteria bacterium]
ALLGSQLKFDGRLILQTRSDGPVGFLVVNYDTAGTMRGYAGFDPARLEEKAARQPRFSEGELLGNGHLAMTIDQGANMDRYQGIVAMNGGSLSDAALEYFRASEQLPTYIRLSVARHFAAGRWRWRAGGLMVQHVSAEGGFGTPQEDDLGHAQSVAGADDDNWRRVEMLARTVEDHELIDPLLMPERLLYRLFHEEGVRASLPAPLRMACRCSRDTVRVFLKGFGVAELAGMMDAGRSVTVTCEFCATPYLFTEAELKSPD